MCWGGTEVEEGWRGRGEAALVVQSIYLTSGMIEFN